MTTIRRAFLAAACLLISATSFAQPPMSTLAGGRRGQPVPSRELELLCSEVAENISAKAACLRVPSHIAVSPDGSVYYSELQRVRRVTPNGAVVTVAGRSDPNLPCVAACFQAVSGLTVDADGNIYISDYWAETVSRLAPDGSIVVVAGNGMRSFCGDGGPATSACLDGPSGLALDAGGNLYIADNQNSRIRRVDAAGIISTFAGNGVMRSCGDGGPAVSACVYFPEIIAMNAAGELLVGEINRVRRIDAAGTITTVAGNGVDAYCGDGGPAMDACFSYISGLAFDAVGNLLIGDSRNSRVRMIDKSGTVSTVAGNGRPKFCGDGGPATEACLKGTDWDRSETWAIAPAVAPDGGIVIVDGGNERIRRVDPIAALTTREYSGCRDGVGRFTLASPAPAGGVMIALDAAGPASVPPSVTIRAGRTSATFPIAVQPVADVEVTRVSAQFDGKIRFDDLVLTPVPPDDVTLDSTATRGTTVSGVVTLACAAGPGGITVTLRSGKPTAAVPDTDTVLVPEGATTAPFTVTVASNARLGRVPIYATASGVTKHAVLTIVF